MTDHLTDRLVQIRLSNRDASVIQIDEELRLTASMRLVDEDEQLIGIRDAFVELMRMLRQQVAASDERKNRNEVITDSNGRSVSLHQMIEQ